MLGLTVFVVVVVVFVFPTVFRSRALDRSSVFLDIETSPVVSSD